MSGGGWTTLAIAIWAGVMPVLATLIGQWIRNAENEEDRAMTDPTLRVLTGNWYDDDGFLTEQGARFPIFVDGQSIEDDLHQTWCVNGAGDLTSNLCTATFSPNAGELERIGLRVPTA